MGGAEAKSEGSREIKVEEHNEQPNLKTETKKTETKTDGEIKESVS